MARNPPAKPSSSTISLGKIDTWELSTMLIFLLATKIFLMLPSILNSRAAGASWIVVAIASIMSLFGLTGWLLWNSTTKDLSFIDSFRKTIGGLAGDVLGFTLATTLLVTIALNIRTFTSGIIVGLLPDIPIEIPSAIVIATSMYAAWLGPETVARASLIFFPLVTISFFLELLAASNMFNFENIAPVLGFGMGHTLKEGLLNSGLLGAVSAALLFKSYLRKPEELPKGAILGGLISGLFISLGTLIVAGAFPYPLSTKQLIPMASLARSLYLGRYVQRVEALFTFTWFFASAVNASVAFIVVMLLYAQVTDSNTFRPLVPSVALITFGLSLIPTNVMEAGNWLQKVYFTAGNAQIVLGWLLFAVAKIRRRSEIEGENK